MRIYLGRLKNLLHVDMTEEPENAVDGPMVCVKIQAEEHSGIPGDSITFRINRNDAIHFYLAFLNMVHGGISKEQEGLKCV